MHLFYCPMLPVICSSELGISVCRRTVEFITVNHLLALKIHALTIICKTGEKYVHRANLFMSVDHSKKYYRFQLLAVHTFKQLPCKKGGPGIA
jgi:hypothetical protein